MDGRKVEAIVVGLWVRAENIGPGERMGDDPGLLIDFLGHQLRAVRRGSLGPWTKSIGREWTRVVKRIGIPPETRDAILSLGLLGATGILEVDDLTIEMVPRDAVPDPNLVVNGDFELGDPNPVGWVLENGATRAFPGHDTPAAAILDRSGARMMACVGVPVQGLDSLRIAVAYRGKDLRGADAVRAGVFFLDDGVGRRDPRPVGGPDDGVRRRARAGARPDRRRLSRQGPPWADATCARASSSSGRRRPAAARAKRLADDLPAGRARTPGPSTAPRSPSRPARTAR